MARALEALGGVRALWVAGSLATGDHHPGVSDLDLVAWVERPPDRDALTALHRRLDDGAAHGLGLGCQYADDATLADPATSCPTWTHGALVDRTVSGVTRAELVRHGWSVLGPAPATVLPAVSDDDVRAAARAEVTGYWAMAARHPRWFRDPVLAELALTGMARARHELATGQLLTKSAAIDRAAAPERLRELLRRRRAGEEVAGWPRSRAA
ncbi:nucleotidyltransferase domain-containing protein [Nocardioides anomalus]|uniref:Nucleotidyltransferase domain-containing protein n=1 Tax=Nocardioides anomalus TaxID=2712223 RepID=A0A6G6WKS2_9ACTN|nr:nucleotidyltransferase domain-containing protein [Nocardioides anomalus]